MRNRVGVLLLMAATVLRGQPFTPEPSFDDRASTIGDFELHGTLAKGTVVSAMFELDRQDQ